MFGLIFFDFFLYLLDENGIDLEKYLLRWGG